MSAVAVRRFDAHLGTTTAPEEEPGPAAPDDSLPEVAAPDVPLAEVPVPDVAVPEFPVPEVNVPALAVPDVAVPDVDVPDVAAPDTAVPELAVPDVPDMEPERMTPHKESGMSAALCDEPLGAVEPLESLEPLPADPPPLISVPLLSFVKTPLPPLGPVPASRAPVNVPSSPPSDSVRSSNPSRALQRHRTIARTAADFVQPTARTAPLRLRHPKSGRLATKSRRRTLVELVLQ